MALRRRRKVGVGGSPRPTRKTRRRRLYRIQEGLCHKAWGCSQEFALPALQECHLKNLGMGASRDNPTDPRNAHENRVLLCDSCHKRQEYWVRTMHNGWKLGHCDWVEPREDNAAEVYAEAVKTWEAVIGPGWAKARRI